MLVALNASNATNQPPAQPSATPFFATVFGFLHGCYVLTMPIPGLDLSGLLPEGIYDCSLDEVRNGFGQFQGTDQRPRLFEKLNRLVQEAWKIDSVAEIVVDGSFVTAASHPNDIDLILVLSRSHNFSVELRPFEYNVLSTRQVRRTYGLDVLVAQQETAALDEYLKFFSQVRGQPDRRKGLLRLRRDQK